MMSQVLEKYFSLLNNKLDRVREAESLTLVQYKLIEERKYDELSENLKKRSLVMEEFEKFVQEIENLNIGDISVADKSKIEEIEYSVKEMISKIRLDNDKLKSMLEKRRDECRDEIRQVSENKKGALGYAQYSYDSESKFFDKKS